MIDIEKAKKVFKEYIKKYDKKNGKIALKVAHIERVSKRTKELAEELMLNEEDIKLAELIGLLHDIGRFEQVKIYNTFNDSKSINHGEFGVKVLFEDGLIYDFLEDRKYDEIIRKAILNHNRPPDKIDKDLNKQELLHAKIIRDSDKTDIYYTFLIDSKNAGHDKEILYKQKITDKIYEEAISLKKVTYSNIETSLDGVIAHMMYMYDINFENTYTYILEKDYFNKIFGNIEIEDEETKKRYETIYNNVLEYINLNNNKGR